MKEEQKELYRNLTCCSELCGTGFWRHTQRIETMNVLLGQNMINTCTREIIPYEEYYKGMNTVVIQRWASDEQCDFFRNFLFPVTRKYGVALIYEIDDAMGADDIPMYNNGWEAFNKPNVQRNVKIMLNSCDLVVVTTNYLKDYYNRRFGVPLDRIRVVPNMLPRWWIGDRYDPDKKVQQFTRFKSRPRIGIVSSLSHYNIRKARIERATGKPCWPVDGKEGKFKNMAGVEVDVKDTDHLPDLSDLVEKAIRDTVDDFQWIVIGTIPQSIQDLASNKKVMCLGNCPILNYPSFLWSLGLQAVVAPLQDIEFNRCKSPIKFLECSALGIPLFASDMLPYKGVVPDDHLFSTPDQLKDKLLKMKFGSSGAYRKAIEQNWKWLNSPMKDGDFELKNHWMEDNIEVWAGMSRIKVKKD